MNPIDLLPVKTPYLDDNPPSWIDFYIKVVSPLIPDVIRLICNGVPINLDKVKELELKLNEALENVANTLESNPLMKEFLERNYKAALAAKEKELWAKRKDANNFIKPYDPKNKVHRSYAVNECLKDLGKKDMIMESWSVKDLKQLQALIDSPLLSKIISGNIDGTLTKIIDASMLHLAQDKADIWNKNNVEQKVASIDHSKLKQSFNCNSPVQKAEFFEWLGIEPENRTKTGNPQWDRDGLENLQKLINTMLGE